MSDRLALFIVSLAVALFNTALIAASFLYFLSALAGPDLSGTSPY